MPGKVYLVGAGPGAIDLITLRGAEVLRRADAVVYDNLVNPGLLRLAAPGAELIYAGKRGGIGKAMEQEELNALLAERAARGMRVVRLKGGDPFIFGRGGEEADALRAAGIDFEVVPGITSAIAAPAYAGIPLTHRDHGSFVAFVTGREGESKDAESTPWGDLARAAARGGTLVILMGTARLAAIARTLIDAGLPGETPAAAVQWGTIADQKTVSASVATLSNEMQRAGLGAPAVIVIGNLAAMREHLRWAERMPLFGKRIVVTRSGDNADSFARELRHLGAEAVEFPTIEIVAPDSWSILDSALARISSFDWVIFTSATGVERFVGRLRDTGRDIRSLGGVRIAAIGPATAARVRQYALTVDAIPSEYRAESIIDVLGIENIRGKRILIPRAAVAREVLPQMLVASGAAEVVVAPAYKTIRPAGQAIDRMRKALIERGYDLVAFTSSSTVSNFVEIVGKPKPGTKAAAIGPITAETANKIGFDVVVQPTAYTVPALIEAITRYFVSRRFLSP